MHTVPSDVALAGPGPRARAAPPPFGWLRRAFVGAALAACSLAALLGAGRPASAEGPTLKTVAVVTGDEIIGQLSNITGLFYDEQKMRLYVADAGGKRLVSFDSEYKYLSEFPLEGAIAPLGLVKDSAGRFFVADASTWKIIVIDIKGKVMEPFVMRGVPEAPEPFVPGRIAIDKEDRLYVIDKLNKRVVVVGPDGGFVREIKAGRADVGAFADVRVDDAGSLYAVDSLGGAVHVFDRDGAFFTRFGGRDKAGKGFKFPTGIAVGPDNSVYVLDRHAGTVSVFDSKGALQRVLLRKGVKEGELEYPAYLSVDKSGRLYVAEGNRVQVFKEEE
jgi:DNA-binding beta-propeller fold protein YncE